MKALKKYSFEPDYAVVLGETLKETMESLNMTQKELAIRTGLTEQTIIRIFKGEQPITHETANRLELVTGVPARFWNNLESNYREQLAKINEKAKLEKVIEKLLEWKNDCSVFDGGIWKGYNTLEDETGISVKELKKIMKKLRDEGKVYLGPTVNQDYLINGSGYFIADAYKRQLEDHRKWRERNKNKLLGGDRL